MPNILLTNYCNRKCPYCFALAQVEVGTCQPNWEMSQDELETVLGYLDFRRDVVSLLGGEPTLHSRFPEIVSYVASRHFTMKIFTNGATPALRQIPEHLYGDGLRFVLNLNEPDTYNPSEWGEIEKNCRHLGGMVNLSFNVYKTDFSWEYLRRAILDWGLGRSIRIGVTQPIRGMGNSYLLEEDIPQAYARLVEMAEDLAADGISMGLDCGFRGCGFTEKQRGTLIECGARLMFDCKPILDIGPELMVWRCFPFSSCKGVKLTDYASLQELIDHFSHEMASYGGVGNTAACGTCVHRTHGTCNGGCLARTVNREDGV